MNRPLLRAMEKTLSIVVVKRKPTKLSIRQRSMWLNHYQLFVLWSPPPPKKKKINSQLLWFRRSVNTGYRLLRKTPKLTLQGDWSPRCSLPGKESLCWSIGKYAFLPTSTVEKEAITLPPTISRIVSFLSPKNVKAIRDKPDWESQVKGRRKGS